ncbi:MAG: 50S ribosomal protein L1 [Rickettsiales bacterium]
MGKKLSAVKEKLNSEKEYNVKDAVEFLAKNKTTKFDETLDAVFNLGVNPIHSDQVVRGVAMMPNGTGKTIRVAAIVKEENIEKAKAAGADLVGADDLVDQIKSGKIDFDVCITTPDMMPKISMVAKILGPKGLMPNPKLGTVAVNFEEAIKKSKSGQVEFRAEKAGIVHAGIGKLSFSSDKLQENFKSLYDALQKARPSGAKGAYVKSVFLSSTMGPSLKLDVSTLS